ncbi:MAG: N(4)-(beta-N-acetylglucosaminyl)-L-asparaginase [Flavobacteriaceae bacterium]|nr:N(4)-(beta-N-acetylglucosaminyl)-L-asparaginase [Flavobacteriaceae bacterium]
MKTRRNFIKISALGSAALVTSSCMSSEKDNKTPVKHPKKILKPIVISTWRHGIQANADAWEILNRGGKAIDAVEKGVMVVESDPSNQSVGFGGLPDRDGFVTLDACIMDENNSCGAVAFLQNIENPIAVARKVMDETPHVLLVGEGALQFAKEKGFKTINLLTKKSKKAWEEWKMKSKYTPVINSENHDTIGMLALDSNGNLSGACTTSGMAYKLHGRVGDSPIIGAGLFVDNEVGAACATGVGEAVMRIAGSAIVVELMRNGMSPNEACKTAVERIIKKHKSLKNLQVGFLALNKNGEVGGYSIYAGFNYAVQSETQTTLLDAKYNRERD